MGGIDDLVDNAEQDEVNELADELGIDDKEELEQLNQKIADIYELLVGIDKQLEETENKLSMHENAIRELQRTAGQDTGNNGEDDDGLNF